GAVRSDDRHAIAAHKVQLLRPDQDRARRVGRVRDLQPCEAHRDVARAGSADLADREPGALLNALDPFQPVEASLAAARLLGALAGLEATDKLLSLGDLLLLALVLQRLAGVAFGALALVVTVVAGEEGYRAVAQLPDRGRHCVEEVAV